MRLHSDMRRMHIDIKLERHLPSMNERTHRDDALRTHPCYNEEAHLKYARMHLPVAPKCNIQCNYCNRKYDCSNESRPGVTSELLTPQQAVSKTRAIRQKIPELKVIGIAGPGDPLANEDTYRTIELVASEFPELTLCISTNGLALPDNAERLHELGVDFLTITINACDPKIGCRIYDFVIWGGKKYTGEEGAAILLKNQLEGLKKCVDLGMTVKINTVMIPGINDEHIPELVRTVKGLGAYTVNILPLIPVKDTKFENMRAPTSEERKELMDLCSIDARMMRHCKQCRADAIGLIGEDRSGEFAHLGGCKAGCGPVNDLMTITERPSGPRKIAVASSDGVNVDCGFGNAPRFEIYTVCGTSAEHTGTLTVDTEKEVSGRSHREHLSEIADLLKECDTVIVKEIGDLPRDMLSSRGKRTIVSDKNIECCMAAILNG